MKRILPCFLCLAILTQLACVDEDFFGLSPYARIKAIELSNQASSAMISNDSSIVRIPFPPGIQLDEIVVRQLSISSFATADLEVGDILDMNFPQQVDIVSEDGSMDTWTLIPEVAGENPQLPNSNFNAWYMVGSGYFEPGESASTTIWGTGNPGTQLLNLVATTPLEISSNDNVARMETLYNGALPAAFGTPISAATIYTGAFNSDNLDPSDPEAAIDFGTPFSGRPIAFRLDYSYLAGAENQDKNEDPLPFPDQCDIYLLLEVRNQSSAKRLGTGWFRSADAVPDLTSIEVPITYGELDDTFPEYMKPVNQNYVRTDSAQFILPTHLTFVATSSFDGASFAGAVGSVLLIDDLELVYE